MKFRVVIFCLLLNLVSAQNLVYWEPEQPIPGESITIFYNHIEGSLPDDAVQVYVHLGYNGWQDTQDYAMSYTPEIGNGWWQYEYDIPNDAETIDFVFTDMEGNWDNNGGLGIDWHISLNYYWTPYYPGPGEIITIVLNNVVQGGEIAWTVDAGNGHALPLESYWPEGSYLEEELVFSPLSENGSGSLTIDLGPFISGEQVVNSIKFKIRWENGDWDVGSNGQIMNYDIYIDYSYTSGDPYVFFVNPTPDENEQVSGTINLSVVGDAETVEFWVDGEYLGIDETSPFEESWIPESSEFGNATIVAIAHGSNSGVSYLFRHVYILYEIVEEPVPTGITDGVNIAGNTITISLYAPFKNFIAVKGSWNQEYPNGELMKISGDTLWWYQIELPDGEHSYQYNVDDEKLVADPWSKDVTWLDPSGQWESGDYTHAKTVFSVGAPEFEWTDQNYNRPEQKDVIIYEMHIGDFNGDPVNTGTFQDVTGKIQEGYFNDLGINTIELMPVNECEGDWSWGYNPSFYMAPESSYGTPDDLKELVNTAHEHGISVLFDVVFNHLWGSSPLFQLYQPLDNWDYEDHNYDHCPYFHNEESPWGYKLQHWHEVDGRQYRAWKHISDVLLSYVYDYHADGFRFDVTAGIGWGGDENGSSFYADLLDDIDPSLILVAEEDNPYQINNSDFDSGWDWSYHHAIFNNLMGYSSNMWEVQNHLQWWSQNWSEHTHPCNYTVSHDETRIIYEAITYANMNLEEAHKKSKLGAAVLFTGTGTPMMYHGQEFGQNSPVSLDPQPLQWENLDSPSGADLFNYFKGLLWLRNNWEVIRGANLEIIYLNNSQKIIGMKRHDEGLGQTVYCVMNFNSNDQTISELPFPYAGVWYEFIQDTQLETDSGIFSNYFIPASSSKIYTNYRNWPSGGDGIVNVSILSGWNMISLPLEVQDSEYSAVYPEAVEGTLYGFDGTYYSTDNLNSGNGYWLFFDEDGTQTVSGDPITSVTVSLMEGWNLIGGISSTIPVSSISDPEGIIVSGTFYGFNGTYVNVENLEPGEGYWVNASSVGEITMNAGAANRIIRSHHEPKKTVNILRVKPMGTNISQRVLYFGTETSAIDRQRFYLPPIPPPPPVGKSAGLFDVRFSNNSKLYGDSGELNVLTNADFIEIEFEVKNNEVWKFIDETGYSYYIKNQGSIELPGGVSKYRLMRLVGNSLPEVYVIHPAFPNPFNPVTIISYELLFDGDVSLVIYDILGEKVKELVRGYNPAGAHNIIWDATGESSGIYFIGLTAGNFVGTQKLVLLK